ncbi:MAG: beta-N-acetylhexosaminidase [Rhodothermales bacterium]
MIRRNYSSPLGPECSDLTTRIRIVYALFALLFSTSVLSGCSGKGDTSMESNQQMVPIVPRPASMAVTEGSYTLTAQSAFHVVNEEFEAVAQLFSEMWTTPMGNALRVESSSGDIQLVLDDSLDDEAYGLTVDDDGVTIRAGDASGAFYALTTLQQMLPADISGNGPAPDTAWILPHVSIDDAPRFGYRGLHLDVGRHFFDVAFVKYYIDVIARYKLNVFHWHLTEDQGWRVEIDAFPRLTEVGAWRSETVVEKNLDPYIGDGIPHGGFYTKEEIRDVVAYAAARNVTVIPEIDIPGHTGAVLAAHPELGCHEGPYKVKTTWGIQEDILCPSEATFDFLYTVLDEVAELFPGPYIHIGADEVPKIQWEESPVAQEVMRREGLADEEALQSWFVRRIEAHLNSLDKQLIGWDEILEGGLAPNATVMSWRGTIGGIEAAQMGHDVIMTPTDYLYFDFYQGDPETEPLAMNWANRTIPLDTVYAFDPIPDELSSEEAVHVLGAQGNVWTEYISTPEYVEYMAFPRAIALSEVVWTPAALRDLDDFYDRLALNLRHLERLGVNYRIPDRIDGIDQEGY